MSFISVIHSQIVLKMILKVSILIWIFYQSQLIQESIVSILMIDLLVYWKILSMIFYHVSHDATCNINNRLLSYLNNLNLYKCNLMANLNVLLGGILVVLMIFIELYLSFMQFMQFIIFWAKIYFKIYEKLININKSIIYMFHYLGLKFKYKLSIKSKEQKIIWNEFILIILLLEWLVY